MNRPSGLRFEAPGEVLKRRVSLLVGAAVLFATSLVLGRIGAPPWGPLIEQALAVWLLLAFGANAYRRSSKGTIFADASGLRMGSQVVFEPRDINAALLLSPEGSVVRVFRRGGFATDVRLESEEKARALLTVLGASIGESLATFASWEGGQEHDLFRKVSVAVSAFCLIPLLLVYFGGSRFFWPQVVTISCLVGAFSLNLTSFCRVDVGSDGVLLRRFARQRFLSYGAMASAVAVGSSSMELSLRSGEVVSLTLGVWSDRSPLRDALVAYLVAKAESAFLLGAVLLHDEGACGRGRASRQDPRSDPLVRALGRGRLRRDRRRRRRLAYATTRSHATACERRPSTAWR